MKWEKNWINNYDYYNTTNIKKIKSKRSKSVSQTGFNCIMWTSAAESLTSTMSVATLMSL
jgi:hypothetical protein